MNFSSLSHDIARNQDKNSSWNDDPFDLGSKFTGVAGLSNERNLKNYAEELVASYAEFHGDTYQLTIEDLSDDMKLELARLYIESIDREIEWACYGDDESLNSSFLCALLALLKNNNPKTRDIFAKTTLKNIIVYYKEQLQNILDDACMEFHESTTYDLAYLDAFYQDDQGE
jgi:hypothetical protein